MTTSKVQSVLIGFAIGDALGVPNEFLSRKRLLDNPVTTMMGFGSHPVLAGTYSDDTAMNIATIDSIINKKKIDYNDIMHNFTLWLKDAKFSASNYVFDISKSCFDAITNYIDGKSITKCGNKEYLDNSSLMRMFPISLYCYYKQVEDEDIYTIVKKVSSLTNSNDIVILGCYIYVKYMIYLLCGKNKDKSYKLIQRLDYSKFSKKAIRAYSRILFADIRENKINDINSSDNIVDTLEAAFWCLLKADSYNMSVIAAINLGDDTDTIGALTGSLAGIIYGYDSINKEWLDKLIRIDYLKELAIKYEDILKEKNLYKQLNFDI